MPIWKGKKISQPIHRVMMCPNCHGKNLTQGSYFGSIFGQPRFSCPDCGYKGVLYVDIDPNDEHENEVEMEFILENPEFLETRHSRAELAAQSLESKWTPVQSENQRTLRDWCPFCADVQGICNICQCPPDICAEQATKGLIGELNNRYDDSTILSEVDPYIYARIVKRFQELAEDHQERS